MDLQSIQAQLSEVVERLSSSFQKVPGSAVLIRYIQSSYQNDPVRSAIELVLVLFFIRYLLSPSYSTDKQNYVKLREDVCALPHGLSHAYWDADMENWAGNRRAGRRLGAGTPCS
jgi:hypothetical protein